MTHNTEYLIVLVFIGLFALSQWQSCESRKAQLHSKEQYQSLNDSLLEVQRQMRAVFMEQVRMQLSIDTLKKKRVTIITKYEPIKQAVNNAPDDSLAAIIRSGLSD